MAEAPHSLELLLSCQVCFEKFTDEGDQVPRILPCSHTLCHTCIGRLIQGQKIECPECRKKHEAKNKEESFPQNKYMVMLIKRKSSEELMPPEFQKCEDHGKELNMFCLEPQCNKPICRTCLRTQHKRHDVTEMEEMQKEILMKKVADVQVNLEAKMKMYCEVNKNIDNKPKMAVEAIKNKKEETVKYFDRVTKKTEEICERESFRIGVELLTLNANLDSIKCVRVNIENEDTLSHKELMNHQEKVEVIVENNKTHYSGVKSFGFPLFTSDLHSTEENCGSVAKEEVIITLPESEQLGPANTFDKLPRIITNASELKCSGIYTLVPTLTANINQSKFHQVARFPEFNLCEASCFCALRCTISVQHRYYLFEGQITNDKIFHDSDYLYFSRV